MWFIPISFFTAPTTSLSPLIKIRQPSLVFKNVCSSAIRSLFVVFTNTIADAPASTVCPVFFSWKMLKPFLALDI